LADGVREYDYVSGRCHGPLVRPEVGLSRLRRVHTARHRHLCMPARR
jgi:hypothetical protein